VAGETTGPLLAPLVPVPLATAAEPETTT